MPRPRYGICRTQNRGYMNGAIGDAAENVAKTRANTSKTKKSGSNQGILNLQKLRITISVVLVEAVMNPQTGREVILGLLIAGPSSRQDC